MPSRAEAMEHILRNLVGSTPDLEGAAVVSTDGLVLASALPAGTDEDRVSAMAAALLSLGERTAGELSRGDLEQVYVKGDLGYVVLMRAGDESVLEAIAGKAAKLGMVLLDMKRAAAELAGHVGQAMLVVRADETSRAALEDAQQLLSACADIKLLLNAARYSPSGRRFGDYGLAKG